MRALAPSIGRRRIRLVEGEKAPTLGLYPGQIGRPQTPTWDLAKAIREGYETSVWLYRGVNSIASNAARLPVVVRSGRRDDKGETVDGYDRMLAALNSRANDYESAVAFRWRVSALFTLNKTGAHVSVDAGRSTFELLPPGLVRPVPGPKTYIDHWEVKTTETGDVDEVDRDRILWIKKPHPVDFYSGSTPIEPAGLALDLDRYARLWIKAMFDEGAQGYASTVLNVKGAGDDEMIRERLMTAGRGRAAVIRADEVSATHLMPPAKDHQVVEIRHDIRDEVLASLGVPLSKVSDASARTFNNADAEDQFYWRETMGEHLAFVGAGYDPILDNDHMLGHDTTGVPAIASADDVALEAARVEVAAGARTINEYRDLAGLPEIDDDPRADALLVPQPGSPAGGEPKTLLISPDGKVARVDEAALDDWLTEALGPRSAPALG